MYNDEKKKNSTDLNKMKITFLCLFLTLNFLITSCASKCNNSYKNTCIKTNLDLGKKVYNTKNFPIFTLQKITNPKKPIRIYIEGDGHAYIDKYTPSFDPTPSDFLLELVDEDNSENIVYIARPCQYIDSKSCQATYWTDQRFSEKTISSIQEVINNFSEYELELVGYSGGATIVNHLNSDKIKNIRTIAGNLDLKEFAKIHKISELSEPKVDYDRLAKIPQIHFIGKQDTIVPAGIFNAYKKHLSNSNCSRLVKVKGAGHQSGWDANWENFLLIPPQCNIN